MNYRRYDTLFAFKHQFFIMLCLVNKLVVLQPVYNNIHDLRCFLIFYLLEGALEEVVDHIHFMGVLGLLHKLHGQDLGVVFAKGLDDLNLL